jgi:hypothetical protein
MAPITITPLKLNDVVRLRKPHPCGGYEWTVVRLGADIGLKCRTCGHRVLLTRREFERRLKEVVTSPAEADAHADSREGSPAQTRPADANGSL